MQAGDKFAFAVLKRSIELKKESGVVKWFSRLKEYGYINPDDDGDDGSVPVLPTDDDGSRKLKKVDFELSRHGEESRS